MNRQFNRLEGVNIVDIHRRETFFGNLQWRDGVITDIERLGPEQEGARCLIPGLIDAHVHIESSMLTPAEFGRIACRHGTVASVSDPHEIANVLGVSGVRFMVDNARRSPFRVFWGAPPCVPATAFETAGAELEADDIEQLFASGDAVYLSEMMNFPGVLSGDAGVHAKLALAHRRKLPVDGHAPGLRGEALRQYVAAGIGTDHECTTLEEAEEKIAAGMCIQIREGSAARNFDTLHPLIARWPDKVMFCSDDKHPDELLEGHIDRLLARAVALGHDVHDVLRCASLNPVRHYNLPMGLLALGERMDAVEVDDLKDFRVRRTWVGGRLVACDGESLLEPVPVEPVNRFATTPFAADDFRVPWWHGDAARQLRVIEVIDGELLTRECRLAPRCEGGQVLPDIDRDVLLLAVVNRYHKAPPALAFVRGFGLRQGALASSVAHDSHNIVAVGVSAAAVCAAVNEVIAHRGGIAAVAPDGVHSLPLPVAGLMSDRDGDRVGQAYAQLQALGQRLGSPLRAPYMTLSFMALLVIPELKLSDQGLFDGRTFNFVDLSA